MDGSGTKLPSASSGHGKCLSATLSAVFSATYATLLLAHATPPSGDAGTAVATTEIPEQLASHRFCGDISAPKLLIGGYGDKTSLCQWFDAKAVLVVNTASLCGYTSQFSELQELHQRFGESGLQILGFPSDNFGGQEYRNEKKTAEVCFANYGVSFPMFRRVDVKGSEAHPLFARLTAASEAPRWNFHKYLVIGDTVTAYPSSVSPLSAKIVKPVQIATSD